MVDFSVEGAIDSFQRLKSDPSGFRWFFFLLKPIILVNIGTTVFCVFISRFKDSFSTKTF